MQAFEAHIAEAKERAEGPLLGSGRRGGGEQDGTSCCTRTDSLLAVSSGANGFIHHGFSSIPAPCSVPIDTSERMECRGDASPGGVIPVGVFSVGEGLGAVATDPIVAAGHHGPQSEHHTQAEAGQEPGHSPSSAKSSIAFSPSSNAHASFKSGLFTIHDLCEPLQGLPSLPSPPPLPLTLSHLSVPPDLSTSTTPLTLDAGKEVHRPQFGWYLMQD